MWRLNSIRIEPVIISESGIVLRHLGKQMNAVGVDNMLQLIQKAVMTDAGTE
jgi:hypothetical protein